MFFLLRSFILLSSSLDRTVQWIVNIYISTWSWIWCLDFLVAWPIITAIECSMNGLFLNYSILNIILLFLMIISSGSWIFGKSLPCIRCFTFMLPKLSSFSLAQKRLWVLSNKLSVWVWPLVIFCISLNALMSLICTRSWNNVFYWLIFTVRNFWLENLVLSIRVKQLLTLLVKIIDTRTWVLAPAHVIMRHIMLFKKNSVYFTGCKVMNLMLSLNCFLFRVIRSWSNYILAKTCVCCLGKLFGWNTWSFCIWNYS